MAAQPAIFFANSSRILPRIQAIGCVCFLESGGGESYYFLLIHESGFLKDLGGHLVTACQLPRRNSGRVLRDQSSCSTGHGKVTLALASHGAAQREKAAQISRPAQESRSVRNRDGCRPPGPEESEYPRVVSSPVSSSTPDSLSPISRTPGHSSSASKHQR